jgi:hypothetical protein
MAGVADLTAVVSYSSEGGSEMTLGIRKLIVLCAVGVVFLFANALVVASWLAEHGVIDFAVHVRREFLTGTAIALVGALLFLRGPAGAARAGTSRRCPVCGELLHGGSYCSACGSKV